MTTPKDYGPNKTECPECSGAGWVKCEHQEFDDHNICLDCGYNQLPDLMDEAEHRIGGPR
jgi:hypothetical protein